MKRFDKFITGNIIKNERLLNKLSQKELAKKIGVCANSICKYETGKRTPSPEIIFLLALVLDTTCDYLMDFDSDKF